MKTIPLIFFLFYSVISLSQTTDLLIVPQNNSIIFSYHGPSGFGFYGGGRYITSFPRPFIYTTPVSIINRVGISIINKNHSISLMGGFSVDVENNDFIYKPDFWLKINPFRLLLNRRTFTDLSFGINYNKDVKFGIGVSLSY